MTNNKFALYIFSGLGILMLSACGAHSKSDMRDTELEDSIPLNKNVSRVIDAVKEANPSNFASIVSYPLERPYPLRNIDDSAQMVSRYHEVVDDSLRNIITRSKGADWSELGWKGWTLDKGQYIWISDFVYSIPYLSVKERTLLADARKREIETLPEDLRNGWEPEFCLLDSADGSLYRMDVDQNTHIYRMMMYHKGKPKHRRPDKVFKGRMHLEGSEQNRVYELNDNQGSSIELMRDDSGEGISLVMSKKGETPKEIEVHETYWMDYLDSNP